jgi:tRNA (guanine37-N1)-methyltransferase
LTKCSGSQGGLDEASHDGLRQPLRVEVFSIFPRLVSAWAQESLLAKAICSGLVDLVVHDLRSFACDPRRSVDDAPFGGGPGMVLACEPVFRAVEHVAPRRPLLLLGPAGRRFDQAMAKELVAGGGFSLLCGRYEGVDERIAEHLCDGEVSLGDFVLSGGEAAAVAIIEATSRLVPGVVGNAGSVAEESFAEMLLEHPQYTRPQDFRGWRVPEVLVSGNHQRVAGWRRAQSILRTLRRRPDLIEKRGGLSKEEAEVLVRYGYREANL